jgi:hypothetical protein
VIHPLPLRKLRLLLPTYALHWASLAIRAGLRMRLVLARGRRQTAASSIESTQLGISHSRKMKRKLPSLLFWRLHRDQKRTSRSSLHHLGSHLSQPLNSQDMRLFTTRLPMLYLVQRKVARKKSSLATPSAFTPGRRPVSKFQRGGILLVALCFSFPCHAQAPWNKSTSYDRSDVDSDSSKNVSPWERPASPPQQVQQYRYEVKHPTASKAILLDSPEIRQSNPAEIRYLGNGTEVEVLATVPDQKIPALSWYRVLVKNGNMRGSVGYISATNIRLMGGPSPSGSQRGGQFSTNSADERIGGTSQASTTNKTGYTMKNSALLLSEPDISKSTQKEFQVGTAVTGTRLELLGVIPDPNITPMKWFYVRMLDGQLAGNTGYVSATNVRDDGRGASLDTASSRGVSLAEASSSASSNDSNQYVLKTGALIVVEPKYANVAEKSKQVGFAITGTRIQLLDQAPTADGAMSWRRVLVLSGDMKGREGWVSSRLVTNGSSFGNVEIKVRAFIPSPLVGLFPLAEGAIDVLPPAAYGGDGRSFSYSGGSERALQKVVINAMDSDGIIEQEQSFGKSSLYSGGIRPFSRPWWWREDFYRAPPKVEKTLLLSPDNNLIRVTRINNNTLIVNLVLNASNPLAPGAPAINSDFHFRIEQYVDGSRVNLSGRHDGFPAYEIYINALPLYQYDPTSVSSPLGLFPGNNVRVTRERLIRRDATE